MRVWLDDIRPMPEYYEKHVSTSKDAIAHLKTGKVTEISLDHDLGDDAAGTGYEVACWIEMHAFLNSVPRLQWHIHSDNPVGVAKMKQALINADQYWTQHEAANP